MQEFDPDGPGTSTYSTLRVFHVPRPIRVGIGRNDMVLFGVRKRARNARRPWFVDLVGK